MDGTNAVYEATNNTDSTNEDEYSEYETSKSERSEFETSESENSHHISIDDTKTSRKNSSQSCRITFSICMQKQKINLVTYARSYFSQKCIFCNFD